MADHSRISTINRAVDMGTMANNRPNKPRGKATKSVNRSSSKVHRSHQALDSEREHRPMRIQVSTSYGGRLIWLVSLVIKLMKRNEKNSHLYRSWGETKMSESENEKRKWGLKITCRDKVPIKHQRLSTKFQIARVW